MKARISTQSSSMAAVLCGALFAVASLSAAAQTNATLADTSPTQATLMPTLSVTATASDPTAAQSWRLSLAKPVTVTLMPVLTVGIETDSLAAITLPTVVVLANIEHDQPNNAVLASVAAMPAIHSFMFAD